MGKPNLARTAAAEPSAEALRDLKGYLRERPAPHARLRLLSEADGRESQVAVKPRM